MSELKENTVQQTLCMPLWGRAIAAKKYPSLFPDHDAGRIVKEMGVDWSDKKLYRFQYMWMCCLGRDRGKAGAAGDDAEPGGYAGRDAGCRGQLR